jgi:hypothetical protein
MLRNRIVLTLAALLLFVVACEEQPASGSGANVVDDEATEEEATEGEAAQEEEAVEEEAEEEPEAALGTRDNPLEVGTRIEMADWTLAVTDVTKDATDEVMAQNEFNDPPVDGRQFVLFRVEATYEGEDSGNPWLDFSWAIVGSAGNTFSGMDFEEDYCGVIPDSLDEKGETYPGGSVEGNVCYSVPADQLDGATIRIEDTFSFEDTRAFYAVD